MSELRRESQKVKSNKEKTEYKKKIKGGITGIKMQNDQRTDRYDLLQTCFDDLKKSDKNWEADKELRNRSRLFFPLFLLKS